MSKMIVALSVMLLAGLAAVLQPFGAAQQKPTDDIEKHRAIWQAQHIDHYRYSLEVSCLCGFLNQPYTTEVKDGKLISALNQLGQPMSVADVQAPPHSVDWFYSISTIDTLFDLVAGWSHRASSVQIRYDPHYGFPDSMRVDWTPNQPGDEITLHIFNFQPLP